MMWRLLFVVLVLLVSISLKAAKDHYIYLQSFTKALHLVQKYYVEDIDVQGLIHGAIKGMLKELDPHTHFLSADMYKSFQSSNSGEFGGIGIEITFRNGILTIISPIEDSQAYKAGIQAGDQIISINDQTIKGLSLSEIGQKLRGKIGTKVKLGILREGSKDPKNFEIERAQVKVRSVKYVNLDSGYAYFRMSSFIEKTYDDFKELLLQHTNRPDGYGLKGLILDLRNNPGGLLGQAIKISDLFIDKGIIVSTKGREQSKNDVIYAKTEGSLEKAFPIIVLINEYSASASEILAGALQDHGRALIMGRRSFGKGSIQSLLKLNDGSALKVTVARYYTPNGQAIQAKGIVPNVKIDFVNLKAYKKALTKHAIKREKDMKGTLKEENNLQASSQGSTDDAASSNTHKKKLLETDFDVLTAYNYLTAYKVLKKSN